MGAVQQFLLPIRHAAGTVFFDLPLKPFLAESAAVFADFLFPIGNAIFFKALDAGSQAVGGLLLEPVTSLAGQHGLAGAAAAVGQHRRTGALGFHGGDAEVLLAGE